MRSKEKEEAELGFQITPMVDIVALLIMFFMCSASSIKTETQIGVNLPGSGTSDANVADVDVTIVIKPDGSVTCNEQPIATPNDIALEELRAKLKGIVQKFGAKIPVYIQPDPGTIHQRVVDVLDACASSGVRHLSFSDVSGGG